ncbi:hypothetical protein QRN89_07995 [Streptomyces chengbuensis]|uniref:hypothetical protein n=1 Tax=Streptomyces chengbuensis TaxID=3053466 RepID=UPI0025B2BBC3|nr:hypothetical protein [Streptomyces sp. HUAS CB01]WJY49751.1 hypothetical protein QRN89_07995 [Streptomyces sp. HUAS CB01]
MATSGRSIRKHLIRGPRRDGGAAPDRPLRAGGLRAGANAPSVPALLGSALLVVAGLGCSPGRTSGPAEPTPSPVPSASASAGPTPSSHALPSGSVPTGSPPATVVRAACEAPLPESWRSALAAGEFRAPTGQRAVLTEVGPRARWTVVQLSDGRSRRAAVVEDAEPPRTLLTFTDPVEHQLLAADVSADGRWTAFAVLEGRTLDSPWSLYVQDAEGGMRRLARSTLPGPLPQPVVRDGSVFWAQGTGKGRATIFTSPVRPPGSGDRAPAPRALHSGVIDAPFAAGALLAWREAGADGRSTKLSALSFATLRPAGLPGPLGALRDLRSPASDGATWAWIEDEADGGEPRLVVWRQGQSSPVARLSGAPAAEGLDQLRISGELITWRTPEAAYALDLRTSAYTRVTPQYGYAQARAGTLAVAYNRDRTKGPGARSVIQVVRADRLPRLAKPRGCG